MADEKDIEKQENENIEEIPESVVWDMIQFARTLERGIWGNVYTPDLINARMKDISYNPLAASQTQLDAALADPKNNEDNLREFGQGFEMISQIYKRLISYLANLVPFDYTYSVNIDDPKDYKSPAYKKDLKEVYKFFDAFDSKKEFSTVAKQLLRNEAYFFSFRNQGNCYILQEMPSQYCKITGRWDRGLLYSFNFYYFMLPGVDIDMFHPFFKERFAELFAGGKKEYNPSLSVDERGKSTWVLWVDIPVSVGWVFKLSPELAARIPYYSPLFSDLILQPTMRLLQKNKNIASAAKILYGSIGMLSKEGSQTKLKDSLNLSPDLLAKFLVLLKSSVSDAIRVGASPLQDVKALSWPSEEDLYAAYLKTALSASGVNTALIYTGNVKPNAIESQLSLEVDQLLIQCIYPQLNDFMDYQLEQVTRKYRFSVFFEGSSISLDRKMRLDAATSLAGLGMVLPQSFAAARGVPPHVFLRQLAEARESGFVEKLTPITPAAQTSKEDAGRPQKDAGDLSESGDQSRADGSNIAKGGKI